VLFLLSYLWNLALCLQAPYISLQEFISRLGLYLCILSISSLSLLHRIHLAVPKDLIAEWALACHITEQVIMFLSSLLEKEKFLIWSAKWVANESEFLLNSFFILSSLACCPILVLNCCWVLPMYTFPVFLYSTF
jgi:hypothetical protein